jgi:oligopeptide transport system permease protein
VTSFILKRLLQGLLVIFVLVSITFFLVRAIPGGPLSEGKSMSKRTKEQMEHYFKLDQPKYIQYIDYIGNVLKGDLGYSMKKEGRRVIEIISQAFPVSLKLGLAAMAVAILVGIPAGVLAAYRKNSLIDYGVMIFALVGICVPSFILGPLLVIFIASNISWLNTAGWEDGTDWILPSIALGAGTAAYLSRLVRGGMLEVMNQDFIRTARAKGASPLRVVMSHALKPGLIPAIAFLGPAFAALITGGFIVETIFAIPGIGQHFVTATTGRDYTLLQGLVLFYGILIVTANILVDVVQAAINPRVRLDA